ncbi:MULTISPECIES: MFS transporter [Leuconostoc]|jgi:MFS transporter, UMF1 family|uniref:MFS transporter n=1 Tax=Leuconostoc TaxID=1243 RepID=UPI001B8D65E4|nr:MULTISPECIES: MFS transporter [Leuconostoc]MBS0958234.1 MFS transporter [Leuconostoc pseudomesenteroides]MCT4380281.1 MFS transporter [Leuconostoc pseudomesenteroides]MDN2451110.1 MFS transporter [Leuconostoc sp. UCMA20149]WAM39471.1 MFS transporter [Leuconostoc pseudomesenteroides]
MSKVIQKFSSAEKGWMLYDWANSGFSLIVVTAVLPLWLESVGHNINLSTAQTTSWWSYANSFSTLIVAFCSPILGALADFRGWKKPSWFIATVLGIVTTLSLALVPNDGFWLLLFLFLLANIGFSVANIYYDSFLTDITTPNKMPTVSSWGFALGYLGGVIPFILFYLVRGLMTTHQSIILAFILSGLWWALFSIPMLLTVKQRNAIPVPHNPLKQVFRRLVNTLKHLAQYPKIVGFLAAYFFYIDGVNTIITEASLFAVSLGIKMTELLTILLFVQLVAFPASIIFGRLTKYFTERFMILVGISIYSIICLLSLFITQAWGFWIMAFLIGSAQGGIQAISRSYFGKIIPQEYSGEFFGFYNIFGKFSAVLGPLVFGGIAALTGSVQLGSGSLLIFFILGGWIFVKYA